jgi:hypothetical protein
MLCVMRLFRAACEHYCASLANHASKEGRDGALQFCRVGKHGLHGRVGRGDILRNQL